MSQEFSRRQLIADEAFMLVEGGEMPEVAFHGALYYLTQDGEGPCLELRDQDIALLKEAVVERYRIIVLRDLYPENKTKAMYRGVERSAANWHRLQVYAELEKRDISLIQSQAAQALGNFLRHEYDAVILRGEASCLNCSQARLAAYAKSLGVVLENEVAQWRKLFLDPWK